jgi:hypothetical protein
VSSALAIAGVSAVLRDLLNDGLINHDASGTLGSTVLVSVGPPDRVIPASGGTETTRLNLFMYQVTPNPGWRNEGLPSRDASGRQRLSNAPLALNLHYLISAHASEDFHGDVLLGYAVQLLHERPVLDRAAIHKALNPSPAVDPGSDVLPSTLRSLADSGLEDQIEQIKVTPEYLNTEEMSKLWTATQSHLRPAAAYMVSVVLIQSQDPVPSPLPVLSRGPVVKPVLAEPSTWYEQGITALPEPVPPLPTLEELVPAAKQPVAQIDTTIELGGHHLDAKPATDRTVLLANDKLDVAQTIVAEAPSPPPNDSATTIRFSIPTASAAAFPVGLYSVSARLQMPDGSAERETNRLAMTLAPTITSLPASVARDGSGTASFTVGFVPALHAGQQAVLVLGQQEFAPQTPSAWPAATLDFVIKNAPVAPAPGLLARLRIDGIESPIIDRSVTPPVFLDRRIAIT